MPWPLEPLLQKQTTRSSIRFAGSFNGSRKVVISLLPAESNAGEGLHYQLYKHRYAELTRLSATEVESLMPKRHDYWSARGTTPGPDWEGFQGFITNRQEVDRLAGALEASCERDLTELSRGDAGGGRAARGRGGLWREERGGGGMRLRQPSAEISRGGSPP